MEFKFRAKMIEIVNEKRKILKIGSYSLIVIDTEAFRKLRKASKGDPNKKLRFKIYT